MLSRFQQQIIRAFNEPASLLIHEPYFIGVFDNFLSDLAPNVSFESHRTLSNPHRYDSPLEKKNTSNSWNDFGENTYSFFVALGSPSSVNLVSEISGIANLFLDPGLHGGGVHQSTRGGKLNLHLDYALHPKLRFERKLNAVYFCIDAWRSEWGGALQLWHGTNQPTQKITEVEPRPDRLVLFEVGDQSWHGFPDEIECPEGVLRTTLALYYCGPPTSENVKREKALFVAHGDQASNPQILDLIKKRSDPSTSQTSYIMK